MKFVNLKNLTSDDVINIRKSLGLTTSEFASLCGVNIKTIERWESGKSRVTGTASRLLSLYANTKQSVDRVTIPEMLFDLRIYVYSGDELMSIIDVNEENRFVELINYTDVVEKLPFGSATKPSYEEYEKFIRSFSTTPKAKNIILNPIDELIKTGGNDNYRIIIEEKK